MANQAVDLEGAVNGYLTALRPAGYSTRYGVIWVVRCRCGTELDMAAAQFWKKPKREHTGIPKSCGCYRHDNRSLLYRGVGDLSSCRWGQIQSSAERKGLEFSITQDYAWGLFLQQHKLCALSGIELKMNPKSLAAGENTASLDRVDNSKGYVVGNVQWVHSVVNDLKSDFIQVDFLRWCASIASFSRGKY